MNTCEICKEKIGLLSKKHEMDNDDGKLIIYCNKCYSKWKIQTDKENAEKKAKELKKILSVNNKWEYLTKKVETMFGSNIKTRDSELQKLGKEGWELVNVALVNQSNFITGQIVTALMTFKRRLP